MTISKPFLGETTNRDEAFPGIDSIDITITQDPYFHYSSKETQRVNHYTRSTIPRYCKCVNPRCQQGGLDLQKLVLFNSNGSHTFPCNGHEGSPKGRRKGSPCDNYFEVALIVEPENK